MKLRNNLQARILLYILSTVLVVFVSVGLFVGIRNTKLATEKAHEYTQLMADKNAKEVKSIFEKHIGYVSAGSDLFSGNLINKEKVDVSNLEILLTAQIKKHNDIDAIWTLWNKELFVEETELSSLLFKVSKNSKAALKKIVNPAEINSLEAKVKGNPYISVSEPFKKDEKLFVYIVAPIYQNGKIVGQYGITLDLAFFDKFIKNSYIYEGGFITVMSNSSVFVAHSVKQFLGNKFSENFPDDERDWSVEKKVAKGERFAISTNFEKKSYYSYFMPIVLGDSDREWAVEVTVPMHKILEASKKSMTKTALFSMAGIVIMILVILITTNRIIGPIKKVTNILDLLSKGDTKNIEKPNIETGDELQEMSNSLGKVVSGLKKTEEFALEIGKGNLENEYTLLGDEDQLGMALLNMRDSLFRNRNEEEKRKKEEEIRNWATQGIAKFAEILRQDNNDMNKLGLNVMSNLINYLDVNQGALFVLNEDNEDDQFYELVTAIAYGRDKFMTKEIRTGEGLVGRCAYEKKTILLKEIPEDYVNITSGLGTSNPSCVLIVPCILNEEVYGVIEVASFTVLNEHEVEFVEKLGESIGATISSVRVNEKTTKLLKASQQQSEELSAQEEEMRQNLEEMQATQEDLQRQMQTNLEMRENLNKQNTLLNALMNNIPDYIYFKDLDSKFIRISKSMVHLFDVGSADEIIGKSDFDFKNYEEAQKYYNDEQEIIKTRSGITDQLQKEQRVDGTMQWNSVTKMPLLDDEGQCIGTFGISKDVTQLKELEIEWNKKQVELEGIINSISNSTYMIQYDTDGYIIDVNDAILDLFNVTRNEVVGTHHKDGFDFKGKNESQYLAFWNEIINGEVKKDSNKITINKKEVWLSETYTPIRDENGMVYKVMKLAFDITEYIK